MTDENQTQAAPDAAQAADQTAVTAEQKEPSQREQRRAQVAASTQTPGEKVAGDDETGDIDQADDAKKAADEEAKKQQANERTKRRREQRRKARERNDYDARIKAESEAAYWRGRAEAGAGAGQQQQQQANQRPVVDNFDTYDDYVDALTDWKLEQRLSKDKPNSSDQTKPSNQHQANNAQQSQQSNEQVDESTQQAFQSFYDNGADKFGADFDDMMEAAKSNEFAATEGMLHAIFDTDNGPDVAMHLYDNPDESFRIAGLSPYRQIREIEKLSKALGADNVIGGGNAPTGQNQHQSATGKQSQPTKRTISNAPAPINPEKASSAPSIDVSKLSPAEYRDMRLKQRKQRSARG